MSLKLPQALAAWNTSEFEQILHRELAQLPLGAFPLLRAMRHGSDVVEGSVQAILLSQHSNPTHVTIKTGIFFKSLLGGCNCADDPTPDEQYTEYGEWLLRIERASAEVEVIPVD